MGNTKKGKVEILLIEDNEFDAELCIKSLKKQNLANNIVHLTDGEEALNYLFGKGEFEGRNINETPKVILLDLKLPKIDGLKVLKEIKRSSHLKHIPVVMMTSSNEERDRIKSYECGANSYVVKPVDFKQFANAVRDIGLYWVLLNEIPSSN